MKLLCGICAIFVVILAVTSENSEELEKFIVEQANICQKETKASDKDVKEILKNDAPTTKTAKCLYACLLNKLGVMDEANKLVPDKLKKIILDDEVKSKDGTSLKDILKDLAEVCKSVSDPDKCESVGKILSCLNAEAKNRGFDKNVF